METQNQSEKETSNKPSIINTKLLENLKRLELSEQLERQKNNGLMKKGSFKKGEKDDEYHYLQSIFKSVVKLYVDVTYPNLEMLWQNNAPIQQTGSGFVIHGNLILTNAHNVTYSTRVLIRKNGDSNKYEGKVLHVSHEADIAILVVSNSKFFENITPLEFGPLPSLRDDVITVGYPLGGDKLSITKGIISRIDVQTYAHSNHQLLLTQIDAPLNPGNSGGPAIVNKKVIGICFQSFKMSSNISYIIPSTIIKHVLMDIHKNGKYSGFPFLGIKFEPLENTHIRQLMGVHFFEKKNQVKANQGILVTEVDSVQMETEEKQLQDCAYVQRYQQNKGLMNSENMEGKKKEKEKAKKEENEERKKEENEEGNEKEKEKGKEKRDVKPDTVVEAKEKTRNNNNETGLTKETDCYGIKLNDVIIEIDGNEINSDGTTKLRNDEYVGFQYIMNKKYINDLCVFTVIRNKKLKKIIVKLKQINYLLPQHNWDKRNKYFIYGGLVFTNLSRNLFILEEMDNPEIYRLAHYNYFKKNKNDEIVILKNILPSKLTNGYNYIDSIVLQVNNVTILNLNQLVSLIENGHTKTDITDTNTVSCSIHSTDCCNRNIDNNNCHNNLYNPYVTYSHIHHNNTNEDLVEIIILTPNGKIVPIVLSKLEVQKEQPNIFKTYKIHEDRFLE